MDVLQAIKERRSVRQYSREPVSENHLAQILEAGRWAPSRGNSQPWDCSNEEWLQHNFL